MSDLIKNLLEKKGFIFSEVDEFGVKLADTEIEKNRLDVEKFLKPNWDRDTYNPFHMKDMEKAVDRIKKAIDNNENMVIYSDYDCDGIPGAVVLHDFFKKIEESKRQKDKENINKNENKLDQKVNKNKSDDTEKINKEFKISFENYIPHRHNEGYGIHKHAIDKFIKDKVTLMITVDLGITNIEEVKYAQENGIDVILTDHHLPLRETGLTPSPSPKERGKNPNLKQVLPPAFAVINTKRDDCEYEEKMLCGCATAWKLAHAFLMKHRAEYSVAEGYEKWWLDMVGISTIADMVPLVDENRVLAIYGLQVLRKSKRQGLQKILANSRIKQQYLNETDIGFGIAPRLNAAGRMSDPREAFLALLDNKEADTYAMRLEKYNNDRKKNTNEANESVSFEDFEKDEVILIGDEKWSPGILGLIASKIVDKTKKTTFVWGKGEDENIMKGSVRAGSDGANVVQLMSACSETLIHFGGHEQAGGFAVLKDKLISFEEKLKLEYKKQKDTFVKNEKILELDITLKSDQVTETLFREMQKLSPFGMCNPAPIIKLEEYIKSGTNENAINVSNNKSISKNIRMFGDKKQHIEINIGGISCVKFSVSEKEKDKLQNQNSYLGVIERDVFKGGLKIRLL